MKYRHDKKYLYAAVTAFCAAAASIAFAVVIFNLKAVFSGVSSFLSILSPILYGLGIAYLLNPIVRNVEDRLKPRLRRRLRNKAAWKLSRTAGILAAFLILALVAWALVSLLVPQLLESLQTIVKNLSNYYSIIRGWVTGLEETNPDMGDIVNSALDKIYSYLTDFLQNDLPSKVQSMVVGLTSSVISIVKFLVNLVVGLIVSVYVLYSKDIFLAQAKKIAVAVFKPERADYFMGLTERADHIFGGFIRGKLVDSLIIGILCYIGMRIINLPYPVLIAVIVGVTNVIPFFGPYIGAIPSAILILVVNPLQGLYFLIFILALQQLDGNVIGPRILGDATGLSGFWVVTAITVFGGLFGFAGMVLGVPVFALIYTLISELVNHFLRQKGRSTDTRDYYSIQAVEDLMSTDPPAPPPGGEAAPAPVSEKAPEETAPDGDGSA